MAERNLNPPGGGTDPKRLRCFVAQPLARASAQRLLAAWRAGGADDWRDLPAEDLHLTLLFLGSVERAAVPGWLVAIRDLDGHAVRARAGAFVGFPRDDLAGVAAAELEPDARWVAWRERLSSELAVVPGPFRPHVTVARRRCRVRFQPRALPRPMTLQLGPPRLFRSQTLPDGARYVPLDEEPG
jgi:2'-5' RNA ligase